MDLREYFSSPSLLHFRTDHWLIFYVSGNKQNVRFFFIHECLKLYVSKANLSKTLFCGSEGIFLVPIIVAFPYRSLIDLLCLFPLRLSRIWRMINKEPRCALLVLCLKNLQWCCLRLARYCFPWCLNSNKSFRSFRAIFWWNILLCFGPWSWYVFWLLLIECFYVFSITNKVKIGDLDFAELYQFWFCHSPNAFEILPLTKSRRKFILGNFWVLFWQQGCF